MLTHVFGKAWPVAFERSDVSLAAASPLCLQSLNSHGSLPSLAARPFLGALLSDQLSPCRALGFDR